METYTYRMENENPIEYRLARRNGELVLQGAFEWAEQHADGVLGGFEWKDIPTVELD